MPAENALVVNGKPADKRVEEARERLALARQRTRESVTTLRQEVSERADWRTWFRAHPELFLSAAFVVGMFLAKRR